MNSRLRISQKLSAAIASGATTVADLCAALGVNAAACVDASQLWDSIVDRYMTARGIA